MGIENLSDKDLIREVREDADGWEREANTMKGWTHFSFLGVARQLRELAKRLEEAKSK